MLSETQRSFLMPQNDLKREVQKVTFYKYYLHIDSHYLPHYTL